MKCNKKRLATNIEKFSRYGKTENGGVTRLSLSEADINARDEFCKQCKELNLEIKVDDLGNIYALYSGNELLDPIVIGSHMDSVIKGGNFDGILGVLTAKEVVQTLSEHRVHLKHPLVIVDFTNEEGVRFEPSMMSSGILTGYYRKNAMFQTKDRDGITFSQALAKSGYAGQTTNRLKKGCAYIELHIEQGPVLEFERKEIGVVEGVVGMVCYEIRIHGVSDHAGTTPMKMRIDPLINASQFITTLYQKMIHVDKDLVFTIGRFDVKPNLHTIIPSDVVFTLDIRHQDAKIIQRAEELVESHQKSWQKQTKCRIQSRRVWERKTVNYDSGIIDSIEKSAIALDYRYKRMYSGAGHDAEFIAAMIPTAMIFVPSIKGKSHCEDEKTAFEDCEKGANVMLQTVLNIDEKL